MFDETTAQKFIEYALHTRALELIPEGRKLKNGRMSPYFFNSGSFHSGRTMWELSHAYAKLINMRVMRECNFNLLYGPPYKGTILAPTVAMMLDIMGYCPDIRFCTSRKEPKKHGERGSLIGAPITDSSRVLIIDDVITDGGTKREAVEFIRQQGGEPVGLVIAFDRQECGTGEFSAVREFKRDYKIPVYAVATLTDLIVVIQSRLGDGKNDCFGDRVILEKILAYKKEYGDGVA